MKEIKKMFAKQRNYRKQKIHIGENKRNYLLTDHSLSPWERVIKEKVMVFKKKVG